jgi:nicotinamidase-related amidase
MVSKLSKRHTRRSREKSDVCVYQTAVDSVDMGLGVQVVADAVSSRTAENKAIGLQRMSDAGARWTSVETALFELHVKRWRPPW